MSADRVSQEQLDRQIEADIIDSLKEIGFPAELDAWRDATPVIDPSKKTLHLFGHPVMSGWEDPYMQKLADLATSRAKSGRVLELGFGMGISAAYIQQNAPQEHVIIEMNRTIANTAREFAASSQSKVTILEGMWQDIVPTLASESFHGILFDTYPLSEQEVDDIFHPFVEHAYRLLAPGGIFTYYSDEATWFGSEHLAILNQAGFTKINGELCQVPTPPDCEYWRQSTILAPIVEK